MGESNEQEQISPDWKMNIKLIKTRRYLQREGRDTILKYAGEIAFLLTSK